MTILFVRGVNDQSQVKISPKKSGKFNFVLDGSANVFSHMGFEKSLAGSVVLFGKKVKQPGFQLPDVPSLIFNQISDPDSHQGALERCIHLCSQIPSPVINHPKRIQRTTRDGIAGLLQGIDGVIMPRTVRCQPRSPEDVFAAAESVGLDFPFIVRITGVHGGKSSQLIRGRQDLPKLHIYPFDASWFYLTEFVDYKSDDGLYRKIRIVVVDGKPLLRHVLVGQQWLVHASALEFMDERPELAAEVEEAFATFESELVPDIQPAIEAISTKLDLEYFGIDCNVNDQRDMLIFEANANMNVFFNSRPGFLPHIIEPRLELIKEHIRSLIKDRAE